MSGSRRLVPRQLPEPARSPWSMTRQPITGSCPGLLQCNPIDVRDTAQSDLVPLAWEHTDDNLAAGVLMFKRPIGDAGVLQGNNPVHDGTMRCSSTNRASSLSWSRLGVTTKNTPRAPCRLASADDAERQYRPAFRPVAVASRSESASAHQQGRRPSFRQGSPTRSPAGTSTPVDCASTRSSEVTDRRCCWCTAGRRTGTRGAC
jgi:hypothetical protein